MKTNIKVRLLMVSDLIAYCISTIVFLYFNPSEPMRKRLIYIGLQIVICGLLIFLLRFVIGVYKRNFDCFDRKFSHIILKIVLSDFIALVVIYFFQKYIIPDSVKIKFVQVMCIVCFNLLYGISSRTLIQSGLDCAEEFIDRSDSYKLSTAEK